jgi:hypothetical protein
MQPGKSRSGTGGDDLHAQFNNRPATLLKSKVWLYCIKSCHAARRRGSPFDGRISSLTPLPNLPSPLFGKDRIFVNWLGFKYVLN